MHDYLMLITRTMPMKTIQVNGEDYLERYYVGTDDSGNQEWLHRFLRADSERHLHSHPWDADSTILCGWYMEQVKRGDEITDVLWDAGSTNVITKCKTHRIIDAMPNTWTLMKVYPSRADTWQFIGQEGVTETRQSSGIDWWKNCKPRAY